MDEFPFYFDKQGTKVILYLLCELNFNHHVYDNFNLYSFNKTISFITIHLKTKII